MQRPGQPILVAFDYDHWLAVARRYSRRRVEAEDLLHDSLIDAVRTGRTQFNEEQTQRWFAGVVRNRAAMAARTAARRERREQNRAKSPSNSPLPSPPAEFLGKLPRSARQVAVLAVAGLHRDEITSALGIAPTAFRQRLTAIRKAWEKYREQHPRQIDDEAPIHPRPDAEFELGLIRRALLDALRRGGATIGAHDPDGHLLIIGANRTIPGSQPPRRRQHRT